MASSDVVIGDDSPQDSYLPDFCSSKMVLAVVLIAELVAIILALSQLSDSQSFWLTLAKSSLFLLWIGLGSAGVLCATKPWLERQSTRTASASAIALLVTTSTVVSMIALILGHFFAGPLADSPLLPTNSLTFLLRNVGISAIASALLLRYFYVAHQWRRNVELQARSRISALQARIRPHFLFNSMNTIAALTRSDPKLAEQAVEDLADLFRFSLSDANHKVRLREELELTRIYQRIEQLRLGERLHVKWEVADLPMRALVPGLCIQPLLENAIYHGIENLPQGGTVTIGGANHGDAFLIEISNPIADKVPARRKNSNQIALQNIRERLELAYARPAKIVTSIDNGVYSVRLWIPVIESEA